MPNWRCGPFGFRPAGFGHLAALTVLLAAAGAVAQEGAGPRLALVAAEAGEVAEAGCQGALLIDPGAAGVAVTLGGLVLDHPRDGLVPLHDGPLQGAAPAGGAPQRLLAVAADVPCAQLAVRIGTAVCAGPECETLIEPHVRGFAALIFPRGGFRPDGGAADLGDTAPGAAPTTAAVPAGASPGPAPRADARPGGARPDGGTPAGETPPETGAAALPAWAEGLTLSFPVAVAPGAEFRVALSRQVGAGDWVDIIDPGDDANFSGGWSWAWADADHVTLTAPHEAGTYSLRFVSDRPETGRQVLLAHPLMVR